MTTSTARLGAAHRDRQPFDIRVETESHYVRPLVESDACERVCAWFGEAENARMLNRPAVALTVGEFREYIASHDRIRGHALGIFEKKTDRQIGLWAIYIDWELREFLASAIIGERIPASAGARAHTQRELLKILFDDLDLETVRCATLAQNVKVLSKVLQPAGLKPEHVSFTPSPTGGPLVEILHFRVSKQGWLDLRARLSPELADQIGV